jgi:integrase
MVTLTAKQARELLEQAEGWLHTLVILGAATGARRAQLLTLRWSEVNLDAGTVRIARSVVLVGGELHWKAPKSEAGTRTIVLGPAVVAELRRHRAEQLERRLIFGPAYHVDEDLVVAKIDGAPIRPDHASEAFRNLVRRIGQPRDGPRAHPAPLRSVVPGRRRRASVWYRRAARPPRRRALALRVYVHHLPRAWPAPAPTWTVSSRVRHDHPASSR